MKARGGGSIVNIGSINAYVGSPNLGPYAVSKGALMTFTKNAACALNEYRIRVNQLNVGWTLTEGEDRVQRKQRNGGEWLEEALALRPWGRLLSPQDIAYAAAYFASDQSALVTGAVLDMEQIPVGAYEDF
jgi:NAD(P)-dependent dehydrogenase (short-subunit alcohol dehydrogenase family)